MSHACLPEHYYTLAGSYFHSSVSWKLSQVTYLITVLNVQNEKYIKALFFFVKDKDA